MNESMPRRILAALSSLKLTVVLLAVFAVAIAWATFVESDLGTEGARALVYNARWFELLLTALTVNLIAALGRWFPFRPIQTGFFLVHVSMIVILVGAAMTRYLGHEGVMHIREGESADSMLSRENHVEVSAKGASASFPVRMFRRGEQSLTRRLELGDEPVTVSVLEYWPHYTVRHAPRGDEPGLDLSVKGQAPAEIFLPPGRSQRVGKVRLAYAESTVLSTFGDRPLGSLEVRVAGASKALSVSGETPQTLEAAGYRFTITEFQGDFTVGATPSGPPQMSNPMIRVQVEGPEGESEERMLFAYHPEFAMQHGKQDGALASVEATYRFEPRVLFSGTGDAIVARASFPLVEVAAGGQQVVPPGREFVVAPLAVYRTREGDFSVVLRSTGAAAERVEDPDAPPAVRVQVTAPGEEPVEAVLVRGRGGTPARLGERQLALSYGPVRIDLPYSLKLDDFRLITYPGGERPAGYESHVILIDEEKGIDGLPVRIHMNSPLTHRSRKHFQSSYDSDHLGTILTVNYDPGKWPTYFGYTLITLGFLLSLLKKWLFPRRGPAGGAFRMAGPGGRGVAGAAIALLLAGAAPAAAQGAPDDDGHAGHDHAGHDHASHAVSPDAVLRLPAEARAAFGALVVQDFQGRMKPVDTLASEIVRKVYKKERYGDWEPIDLYLSWLAAPDSWWQEPLIHVRFPELKELIGVPESEDHVAAAALFGPQGDYLLLGPIEAAYRTPDRDRTKLQRKLLSFDERLNLLYLSLQGRTLRVLPIPGDPTNAWGASADVLDRLDASQRPRFQAAVSDLLGGLGSQDVAMLRRGIEAVRALQAEFGAEVLPGKAALDAELFLNRTRLFSRLAWPYLFVFFLLLPAYVLGLLRQRKGVRNVRRLLYAVGMVLYAGAFVAHVVGYVMRWVASGYAPLSNGFESLLFISLAVALSGILFDLKERSGAASSLAALMAFIVLGISMASHFDPAIGLLVPVLNSNWLIIHVTVITASYGFLGLGSMIGGLILILYLLKGPGRDEVRKAIFQLDFLLSRVIAWGIALLTVGTLLGGVWANESWGRYWGWDPKETWSLVTILVYATVQHLRWIPFTDLRWHVAAGSFAGIASIIMTYFGVNYFLAGLHSYAQGSAPEVPSWVYIGSALMLTLIAASWTARRFRVWDSRGTAH